MRVLVEVLHILAGLVAAALIAAASAWGYPLARHDIWLVAYVAMAVIVVMGLGPLRRAYAIDRARLARRSGSDEDVP